MHGLAEASKLFHLKLRNCERLFNEVRSHSELNKVMNGLERIRVLQVNLKFQSLPSSIAGLIHLCYLDLSGGEFILLPESVCTLHNLQTLKLKGCHNLKELPGGTKFLVNLRHLDIRFCSSLGHMPHGLGKLTSLQSLSDFVIGPNGGLLRDQLVELNNLAAQLRGKYLAVKCTGKIKLTNGVLNYPLPLIPMIFLEILEIDFFFLYTGPDQKEEKNLQTHLPLLESLQPPTNSKMLQIKNYYMVSSFPSWLNTANICSSLPNIVHISLWSCHCVSLPLFGLLPSLQILHLYKLVTLLYIHDERNVEKENSSFLTDRALFPSLKVLHLESLWALKGLMIWREVKHISSSSSSPTPQDFPALQELRIKDCEKLDLVVMYNESLEKLRTLKLSQCGALERELSKRIGIFTSLEHLQLDSFSSWVSLPASMQCLTSLQELRITNCTLELANVCKRNTGKDWPLIAHIPLVTVEPIKKA